MVRVLLCTRDMRTLVDKHKLLPALYKGLEAERRGMGITLRALVPIHEKEAYLDYGFSSLHVFLVKHCGLSDGSAFRRTHCVALIVKHPKLLDAIESGKINLSNLTLVRNIVNDDNVEATIELIAGKTNREVEKIVATLDPKARPKSGVCKLRAGTGVHRTERPMPIDGDLYKFIAVFGSRVRAKLEHIFEMMRRENPSKDPDVLFEAALDALEKMLEKRLFAKTDHPRNGKSSKHPGHISNATKREVYARDGGQCTFVTEAGVRCAAREFLEFDHIDPRSRGGDGSPDNVRLLCSAHHRQQTKKTFGCKHIEMKRAQRTKGKGPGVASTAAGSSTKSRKAKPRPQKRVEA